jgi:MoxR-like ATPase
MTKRSSKPTKQIDTSDPAALAAHLRSTIEEDASPRAAAETVVALAIQAHVPVFIYSGPGTGKSATMRSITDDLNETLYTIMLSTREPTDQGGLPAIFEDKGEKLVRLIAPGWARDLIRAKRGVVLFDEITNATTATMNSGLRVVQEGVVGDGEKLPADTSFVLAGNPPETNVGANDLTAGMANRCLHVAWPLDYQRWRAGMLSRWAPGQRKVARLPKDWRDGIPEMATLVVSFLDTQSTLAQAQPADVAEQGRAWPSGRTWDLTATMLAAANAAGYGPKSIVARMIVLGLVGEAAQTAWSSWVANMDLPSIESVIADPDGFAMPPRQDQILTILTGVVRYVAERAGDLDVYMRAWTVANRVLRDEPSLAIRAVRDLGALMPAGADKKTGTPFHQGLILSKDHLRGSKVDYGSART